MLRPGSVLRASLSSPRPQACPSLIPVKNARLLQTLCHQAMLGPVSPERSPHATDMQGQAQVSQGPGHRPAPDYVSSRTFHLSLTLQAQDNIYFLLREPMICFSHVSFPAFFFFN